MNLPVQGKREGKSVGIKAAIRIKRWEKARVRIRVRTGKGKGKVEGTGKGRVYMGKARG